MVILGKAARPRSLASLAALAVLASSVLPATGAEAGARPPVLDGVGTYEGFGEGFAVAMAGLDGGRDRIVLGGRGIAVLDESSLRTHRPRWSHHWADSPDPVGGDHLWTNAVEPLRDPATRRTDLIVSTNEGELIRFDGRGGKVVWRRPNAWSYQISGTLGFVSLGAGRPPAIVGQYGTTAYSSADGRPLWTAAAPERAAPPRWANPAELGAGPGQEIVFGAEPNCGPGRTGDGCNGHVYAHDNTGKRLWHVAPAQPLTALATADITGDGRSEIIAGEGDGSVTAYSPDGEWLWRTVAGQSPVPAVAVVNGRVHAATDSALVAFDGTGERLWSQPMAGRVTKLEGGDLKRGRGEQLLAVTELADRHARLVAVDPARSGDRRMWHTTIYGAIHDFTVGTWHGRRVVTVGSDDATLRGLWAETGRQAFDYLGQRFVTGVAAGRLSGHWQDTVAHTDDRGNVVLSDTRGRELWHRRLGGGPLASAHDVMIADLGRRTAVVAAGAGTTFQDGVVRAYDGRGRELWTGHASGRITQLATARLSRRGPKTILAAVSQGGRSAVAAFDPRTGERMWERTIAVGAGRLAAGDADGDGLDEIAFSTTPLGDSPGTLALLSSNGDVRWRRESFDIRRWVAVVPHRVLFGGRLAGGGSVGSAAGGDGAEQWRADLPGFAEFGVLVPQRDGVAVSTDAGLVGLVDIATGRVAFRTRIASFPRNGAGPLTLLAGGGRAPRLVAGETSGSFRTRVHVLSLDGRVLTTSKVVQQGGATDITPVAVPGRGEGVAVGAGLSVYTYRYR